MAQQLGENAGQRVGYRTKLDTKVSAATQIEVVTEGILTRIIQNDPMLENYAAIIFDEFHERSLHGDLGLALVRESQQALREDLRVLIMSATLDTTPIERALGEVPVITSEGRSYPVEVFYRPAPQHPREFTNTLLAVIREALAEQDGSILVFLPGVAEIHRVERRLREQLDSSVVVAPLFGNLGLEEQDRAISPAPTGKRKIVLATAIAETSLTIEGVRVIVDSGQQRRAVFNPNSGMSRLITTRVSKASAEQRKGRAGRTESGVCYRLWSAEEHGRLPAFTPAEIQEADLVSLVLELAQWGARSSEQVNWIDPPSAAHWRQAQDLLQLLGMLDKDGAITEHGKAARQLGVHPRLANMVLFGRQHDMTMPAAELAALLEERDILGRQAGADLHQRLRALRGEFTSSSLDKNRLQHIRNAAKRLARFCTNDLTHCTNDLAHCANEFTREPFHCTNEFTRELSCSPAELVRTGMTPVRTDMAPVRTGSFVGRLLAQAYPDRIAKQRASNSPRYQLSNGKGASLRNDDALVNTPWLVAAELDGKAREATIYLAAAITQQDIEQDLAHLITETDDASWDQQRGTVLAKRVRKIGELVLSEKALGKPASELIQQALLAEIRNVGLHSLPWTDAARQWCARVNLLAELFPNEWPAVHDDALLDTLENWLLPFLAGAERWADVKQLNVMNALTSLLSYEQQQRLQQLAPATLTIPTGQQVRLDYATDNGPILAAKLQALFGWQQTPTIADGRVAVVVHLLSPAQRPLAVTADLANFWQNVYPEVRKDMRGRYPKHPWPEDPFTAQAQQGVKRK